MDKKFKKGMYVRVSVDYENDEDPRIFATGQIDSIDQFGNIKVVFNKEFRSKEEGVIYDYIPDYRIYPESKVKRCKLIKRTTGLFGFMDKFTILKLKDKDENGYYRYYVESDKKVIILSEENMIVDFTRGEISPVNQMKNYEFQSPFWYGQRLLPSEVLNILNNLDRNFRTLISSRAYLFQHQIDTIIRALKEEKVRLMFADEVGLGKTIEALVVLKGMNLRKALIVVPNSLINQWKNEINVKLWMDSFIYEGGILPKKGIVLIPFEKLEELDLNRFTKEYDFCIIDEVHRCLRDNSLFDKLHKICKEVSEVILLSATPIQDRKEEYLKLLKLLKPELYDEMSEDEFLERYKKSIKIRKKVYAATRDLEELDEDMAEVIQEDLADICDDFGDRCLEKIVDEIDIYAENYGEEKIREALAYIAENYQFEKNIIRHRREEIENEMSKRTLKKLSYEMRGREDGFYEYNTYEKVFGYVEYLLDKAKDKNQMINFAVKLINAMFSSPWALEELVNRRFEFINGRIVEAKNRIHKELQEVINNAEKLELEKDYILEIRELVSKWAYSTQLEIDNISDLVNDPDNLKGRFAIISDYIDQELYEKKTVIFTAYPETLIKLKFILENLTDEKSIATFSTLNNRNELEEEVQRFQNDEECRIMICDESGGDGRNFQSADTIIHFDIPFSPTILEQRIGRLDRIGRDKNKDVENIVIFTQDTLEQDLFNVWDEGLNVFNESLSGLEIALDSINNSIIQAMRDDLKYGLSDILEDIKDNLNKIRESVEEERYYDMSRQLDSKTKERYENVINKFDSKGGELLARSMLKWCKAVGFSPIKLNTDAGIEVKFDETSVNYKSMGNTMFDIPDTIEILKRRKSVGITGTFDRTLAVKKENLAFFAPGEKIFDSIMKNVEEGYRGRCSAVKAYGSKFEWEGFIVKWNIEFNIKPLIEAGLGLNYKVYSNGHMPLGQIVTFVSLDRKISKDDEDYILEFIRENYNHKSMFIHLGSRDGNSLKEFKNKYNKSRWNEIITKVMKESSSEVKEKYSYGINKKEVLKELNIILAGARASKRYFNNDEIDCDELKKGLEKVKDGILKPDVEIDSILYINLKKGMKND